MSAHISDVGTVEREEEMERQEKDVNLAFQLSDYCTETSRCKQVGHWKTSVKYNGLL